MLGGRTPAGEKEKEMKGMMDCEKIIGSLLLQDPMESNTTVSKMEVKGTGRIRL